MLYLEASDPEKDIQLYINSSGGSVTAGFAIYDTEMMMKLNIFFCVKRISIDK